MDFLIEELRLCAGATILDVGCGTGRHAIELARRGFAVTGVDISAGMLAEAGRRSEEAGVKITWIQANAAEITIHGQFDGVICLCEGAFGLLGREDDALEQPLAILRLVARALKPGARCLFTVLNGFAIARRHSQTDVEQNHFDPLTLAEVSECCPEGDPSSATMRERGFVPTELRLLFGAAGLTVLHIWGGTAGAWRRGKINLDEIEIMAVGQRPAR